MIKVLLIFLLFLLNLTFPGEKCIESVGVGEASVINGDRASAKAEAFARAKWDAIEKALGVRTSVKTVIHNFRLLDEVIKNEVRGFIKDVKILEEKHYQDAVVIKIKGCVYPLEAEKALSLISRDTAFIVIFLVDWGYGSSLDEMNPVTVEVINLLNQQGFKVYDFAGNPEINPYELERVISQRRFITLRNYMSRYLSGAVIIGKITFTKRTSAGQDIGYGIRSPFNVINAHLNYYFLVRDPRGVRILASGYVSSEATALNEEEAKYRALRTLAQKTVNDIMQKVERYMVYKRKNVDVIVEGVEKTSENFAIKERLQRIPWVESVEDAGLGRFRVVYLENTIYLANAIERIPELELIEFGSLFIRAKKIK